ncbi:hypothetical protein SCOR_05200 [Sulfidibacter corallicola]|uniref:DUF2974 domain-containing protein n=1 Tax=Sulfidibacter corallicola TaxID=2818388 RepID=A0A8A4TQJ7_SULCO|nr:hypothetical protein [Sulfidibacter corallicola]QTD51830.1 hypothetical protein J3U87_05110 [Sulfidibacter corallicola]
MKRMIFCLTLMSLATQAGFAQGTQVLLEKVRYCRFGIGWCNGTTPHEYRHWEHHDVAKEKQKRTFITRYNEPEIGNVSHLVFISAGQREEIAGDPHASLVTGQPEGFADSFSNTDAAEWKTIDADSLPVRMFEEGVRDPSDTFAAMAFDARFNWGFTGENKREIVNAYFDWLRSKYYGTNIRSIYLAGHSRGGALVTHLAKKFKEYYPGLPVILHLFDAVPNINQLELASSISHVPNPLDGASYAYLADFQELFPQRTNLAIFNFISGAKVITIKSSVRAMVDREAGLIGGTVVNLGWYRHQWYNLGHVGIARNEAVIDQALDHLVNVGDPIIDDYIETLPPEVQCGAYPNFGIGLSMNTSFSGSANSRSGAPIVGYEWRFSDRSLRSGSGPHDFTLRLSHDQPETYLFGSMTAIDGFGNRAICTCEAYLKNPNADDDVLE